MLKYSIAALALVATSTFALAEPMDHNSGSSSGSAVEHAPGQMKEPGSSAREGAPGQMKGEGSAKEYAPGQNKSDRSEGMDKRSDNDKASGESKKSSKSADKDSSKLGDHDRKAANDRGDENGSKANRDASRDEKGSDRNAKNEKMEGRDRSSTGASEGAEGHVGSKGQITGVTEEQRTRVKSVFSGHRVEPARNLNVSVNIGVAIPRSVHIYPVPEEVVTIVPEYRGYDYILLEDGRVAIIDPSSFEIVDIIVVT